MTLKRLLLGMALASSLFGPVPQAPATAQASPARRSVEAQMIVHADTPGPVINKNIYGQFAEHLGFGIYGGVWVGEDSPIPNTRGFRNDVVAALKAVKVPVIRWPGGCFADEYNWREGIGPRSERPTRINTHWGGVEEPNAFGTHEFMNFAELIGADAYVAGNMGSGSPREMADWVEYITSPTRSDLAELRRRNGREQPWKLPFFGVGNESWGCGGNMRAEYSADLHRRYQTYVKAPAGTRIEKIASGSRDDHYGFTEVLMREAGGLMDGLSLHYYTFPGVWERKGSSTDFDEGQWASTLSKALFMDELITKHGAIMNKYDPGKRVMMAVDEWGVWTDPDPGTNPGFLQQQNSLRDALVAALHFNIFHRHADRVRMANIAQMVNVLQAMILTSGEKMVLTPTYHVFDMYKPFQDATSIPVQVAAPDYVHAGFKMPAVHASAGRDKAGVLHVALVNLDPDKPARVSARLAGLRAKTVRGRLLTAPAINAVNTFDRPDQVRPVAFTGARAQGDRVTAELPAKSIAVLSLE